jgi:hypothetical protein
MVDIITRGKKGNHGDDNQLNPKIVITYDPKYGQRFADGQIMEEYNHLVKLYKKYEGTTLTISRMYGNSIAVNMVRLLYIRGVVDHSNIFCKFEPGGFPMKLNKYGVWENVPNDFGRLEFDIAIEIAKFSVAKRQEERENE